MSNRLLFISSLPYRQILLGDLLSHFKATGQSFFLLTKSRRLLHRGQAEKWLVKTSRLPVLAPFSFFLSLPFIWLFFGLSFIFHLWRWQANVVILSHWPEKIAFSALANLLGKKVFWLEYPDREVAKFSFLIKFFYRHANKKINFIVFGNKSAENLRSLVGDKNISVILPAANAHSLQQHSIFKNLAEQTNRGRFVVGSVLYGLPRDQAERLLSALSIAQTVCPTIELVIIGAGKNRKQIQWLARRMNLERRVWLAGPTSFFQRWIDQLDVYVVASKRPSLEDSAWAITAMTAGLPVIAAQKDWLAEVVNEKTGVLVDVNDPEILARQLISLQQDKNLCERLGKQAKLAAQNFSFNNFVTSFTKLLS